MRQPKNYWLWREALYWRPGSEIKQQLPAGNFEVREVAAFLQRPHECTLFRDRTG